MEGTVEYKAEARQWQEAMIRQVAAEIDRQRQFL